MGETSKRIGEKGEEIVEKFLNRIGWDEIITNEDIESYDKEFRKKTNGMDGFFYYKNPFIDNCLVNVLYSVKYSSQSYVKSKIKPDFKSHALDLSKLIESFTKSNLRKETSAKLKNINTVYNRGLVFWINSDQDNNIDLINELSSIDFDTETNHDGIFLIDNLRFDFINRCLDFLDSNYKEYERFYIYFTNGLNNNNRNARTGKMMPLEFVNSSLLPFVLKKGESSILVLFSFENFEKESLIQIMGLAKNLSNGIHASTLICFPDYSDTNNVNDVKIIKKNIDDANFTQNLTVENFNNPQRN